MAAVSTPPGVLRHHDMWLGGGLGEWQVSEIPGMFSPPPISEDLREVLYAIEEDRCKKIDAEISQVSHELEWVSGFETRNTPHCMVYYNLEEYPGEGRQIPYTDHFAKCGRCDWEIEAELNLFEADWDYENWINSLGYKKAINECNFHRLLAWQLGPEMHPQWAGSVEMEEARSVQPKDFGFWGNIYAQIGGLYIKARFLVEATISYIPWEVIEELEPPKHSKRYGKASSAYGDIYIPHKFLNHIPAVGEEVQMTVALQDVGGCGKKANGFRFTCIYLHRFS